MYRAEEWVEKREGTRVPTVEDWGGSWGERFGAERTRRSGPAHHGKEGKEIGKKSEGEGGGEGGIGELEGETFEEWQLEGRVEKLERERAEGNRDFVERKDRNKWTNHERKT